MQDAPINRDKTLLKILIAHTQVDLNIFPHVLESVYEEQADAPIRDTENMVHC